jgi:hypothetical protein
VQPCNASVRARDETYHPHTRRACTPTWSRSRRDTGHRRHLLRRLQRRMVFSTDGPTRLEGREGGRPRAFVLGVCRVRRPLPQNPKNPKEEREVNTNPHVNYNIKTKVNSTRPSPSPPSASRVVITERFYEGGLARTVQSALTRASATAHNCAGIGHTWSEKPQVRTPFAPGYV